MNRIPFSYLDTIGLRNGRDIRSLPDSLNKLIDFNVVFTSRDRNRASSPGGVRLAEFHADATQNRDLAASLKHLLRCGQVGNCNTF